MKTWFRLICIVGLSLMVAWSHEPCAMAASAGVEWINDFPGTADDRDHWDESGNGFYNKLLAAGWTGKFHWTNWSAWEKDFKRAASGGWEESYADNADCVMLCTHGSTAWDPFWSRTNHSVYFGSTVDDHHLVPGDAYHSYGTKDAEWICFDSCSVLADRGYWHTTFSGLHLMLGFANTMYVISYGDGRAWAEYMIDDGWWDFPRTVTQAWFSTVDDLQPSGVTARVIAEVQDNYNDYLHGQGYVSPDPVNNGYYWYWDHTAGSEPALQVAVVPAEMSLYQVIQKQVDPAYVEEMARKFTVTGKIGEDRENYYVAQEDTGEVLTVDRFQGSFRYHNLKKLWTAPPEPPRLPTPGAGTEIALSFLRERQLVPPDASFYETVTEYQVEVQTKEDGQGGLVEEEIQKIGVNLQAEFARHLALDSANQTMVSVMGPGGKLKVYIGDGGEVIGAHGGWKDVRRVGMVPVLPQAEVLRLFETYGNKISLERTPAYDAFQIKRATLGYYERRFGEGQRYLIPAWILDADFFLTPANLPESRSAAAAAEPYASGYIYLPASQEFIPLTADILQPPDGSTFLVGEMVTFSGQAEFGVPPYTLRWYSDADGYLGEGQKLATAKLSVVERDGCIAPHTITLKVTDSQGNTASDSIKIKITPPLCEGDYDLDGDVDGSDLAVFAVAYMKGDLKADLNGDGAVNAADLAIFAADFGRTDCPTCG